MNFMNFEREIRENFGKNFENMKKQNLGQNFTKFQSL